MHIAIVIVGFKNFKDIRRCIDALDKSTYQDFEIIICENGDAAAYDSLQSNLPECLGNGQKVNCLLAESNLGYAGGVNLGITNTPNSDAWWVLNPDTVADANALAELVKRYREGNCDVVGGVQYFPDERVQSDGGQWLPWLARAKSIGYGRFLQIPLDNNIVESKINYITGASMLISRNFVETVGLMREDYFLYCEEVEWCLRGKKLGMKFGYAPDAHVLHFQGGATGAGKSITKRPKLPIYLDERNKILVTRDCYRYCLPIVAIATLFLLAGRYLRRGAIKQFCYGIQGWKDGLLNRRGIPEWLNP